MARRDISQLDKRNVISISTNKIVPTSINNPAIINVNTLRESSPLEHGGTGSFFPNINLLSPTTPADFAKSSNPPIMRQTAASKSNMSPNRLRAENPKRLAQAAVTPSTMLKIRTILNAAERI
ncbi:MAG TPA: hypothetical protein VE862_06805 [Candidatus Acidoferrum sp.]|nr:hypothetical protein [Candidatus Acidoferrum sp.]